MGCPRVNAGKWHVVLRQLLHADVTSSKLLPATQEAAPPHIACGPSPAVLARSLQSSRPLPANIDFPVNFHATHVQHTCNTCATHVQHNVQHEHFHCKFTGKIAFSRPPATKLRCFHLKAKVGLQRQKNTMLPVNLQ